MGFHKFSYNERLVHLKMHLKRSLHIWRLNENVTAVFRYTHIRKLELSCQIRTYINICIVNN